MTIPASAIVQVNPGVIGTGGNPLALNGLIVDTSIRIPVGSVIPFTSGDAVEDYFGIDSVQAALAAIYFLGYDNSYIKPGMLYFAPYADAARAAWVRSATGLTLSAVQALDAGTLTVVSDGTSYTTASVDLSTATSLSDAASTIQAAAVAAGHTSVTCIWDATYGAFVITSGTTGDASTMEYVAGTLAAGLKLTQATGATLSQGTDADSPATAMEAVVAQQQNWATFMTTFEPDGATKLLFADWVNAQDQRYAYAAWDSDETAVIADSDGTFGAIVNTLEYDGVIPISGDSVYCTAQGTTLADASRDVAAFVLGSVASIDFSRTNARITNAFKSQSGLGISCADEQKAENLMGNGYNFYGSYATANDEFVFLYDGQMSGKWKYIDPYANQIYMNAQFQLALLTLLTTVPSIPYNEEGYNLIRAAMQDPIEQAVNFGGIRKGVQLSNQQKAVINSAAGVDIDRVIEQDGWYLQVKDPGAQVRGNRGTPVINFWYTDGGAVHKIQVASIDVM